MDKSTKWTILTSLQEGYSFKFKSNFYGAIFQSGTRPSSAASHPYFNVCSVRSWKMWTHCKAMASVDLHVIDGQLHNVRQKCRLSNIMSFVFILFRLQRRSSIIDTGRSYFYFHFSVDYNSLTPRLLRGARPDCCDVILRQKVYIWLYFITAMTEPDSRLVVNKSRNTHISPFETWLDQTHLLKLLFHLNSKFVLLTISLKWAKPWLNTVWPIFRKNNTECNK